MVDHRSRVVQQFGDLKKPETAIGTGQFMLERYDRTSRGLQRNPDYYRGDGQRMGWGGHGLVISGRIDRSGDVLETVQDTRH